MRPHVKVIWKWWSIALQRSVLSVRGRVHMLPQTVISRYSNTYANKPKRLGVRSLPLGRLEMVISTYSNILLSVSMMNARNMRVEMQPRTATWIVWSTYTKPPRRRGTLEPYEKRTRTAPTSVYNTSSTIIVLSHLVGCTRTESYATRIQNQNIRILE